jgi:hypothetical protein
MLSHLHSLYSVERNYYSKWPDRKEVVVAYLKQYHNKKFYEELIAYFPWYDTGHNENGESNNSSIVACVFVTSLTFPPSRCLATIGGFLSRRCLATIGGFLPSRLLATIRGLLPSRCLATTGGEYADTHAHRQQRDLISIPYFFQNKDSRLKTACRGWRGPRKTSKKPG